MLYQMDPRTTVHRSVHEDISSEEDERLSPGAPSVDEDNDSDKSSSNSKKRKRGSYRCSRCGMPKRGHNCPDNFEGVHFAIVDTPSPGVQGGVHKPNPNPFNLTPPGLSVEDCPRETLLMHLSTLHDDNMRLLQENARLHDMLQMQAHAFNSMTQHSQGAMAMAGPQDFHPGPAPLPLPRPNGASNVPPSMLTQQGHNVAVHRPNNGPIAASMTPAGAPMPVFAPAFANAQAPPHLMPSSQQQQQQPTASSAPLAAANRPYPAPTNNTAAHAKVGAFPAIGGLPSSSPSSAAASEASALPSAKRAKLEESFNTQPSFHGHPMMPAYNMVAGHFGQDGVAMMDHRAGAHHFGRPIPATGEISANGFEYDYDRHDWLDDSDSSSDFYPPIDAVPTLIY